MKLSILRRLSVGQLEILLVFSPLLISLDEKQVKNEWGTTDYPLVPGHEIVGIVTEVGNKVRKFKVGDRVGVGCLVDSCHSCQNCANNLENYCPKFTLTDGSKYSDGTATHGGYSDSMVSDEHFIFHISDELPLDAAAPLLCAGITVYSPFRYFGLDKPVHHLAKKKEAIENLGADSFLISRDQDQMNAATGTLDGIIDTVSADHPLLPLIGLLKCHGKLVMVGAPEKPLELPIFPLLAGRKIVAGSLIGGIKETQEMIDFAAKYNVKPDIEIIPIDYVNIAMERLLKADVKYRFVIDIGNTLKPSY
ncbi:cinnamyl-alcohol dehydrogenase [Trifolium repens]|nr:cinnamyl-alcohol dehydrogenase [Trifolium repens]